MRDFGSYVQRYWFITLVLVLAGAVGGYLVIGWLRPMGVPAENPSAGTPKSIGPTAGSPPSDGVSDATDDEFSIAVVPDTQRETWTDADNRFRDRSDWLIKNSGRLNLRFMTHVGDVVDWGNISPEQFVRAKQALAPLAGKVPYSLTIGNHDTAAVCQGGSACPGADARITVRDTRAFNHAFQSTDFANLKGEFEPGKIDNTYSVFNAGGQKWLLLNLELWPRESVIKWARKIVGTHTAYNVVVSTHSYLEGDGTVSTNRGGYGATSPEYLYNNLIKVYPNIRIVLSGHVGTSATRIDIGDNGNKIASFLQCYHSETTNPVRILKISTSQGSITDWVYAPHTGEILSPQVTTYGFDFRR